MGDIRDTILEVAAKRFIQYGYHKTTVEEIARDADIGKGSIYLHFKSKEEILLELVRLFRTELVGKWIEIQKSRCTPERKLYHLLKTRLNYVMDKKTSIFSFSVKPERLLQKIVGVAEEFKPQYLAILESVLSEGEHKGIFHIKDRSEVATILYEMVSNILYRINFDQNFPYESYFESTFSLMVQGLLQKNKK
ncbi:MAG TPA: TetR/AcrR family transcriptional regulator [Syntrophaceae bacterium]|nr:TetR/AcrR family transcriptional regulator [Syntrophaceae bacterium]